MTNTFKDGCVNTVAVTFRESSYAYRNKRYNYLCDFDVRVGDTLVVDSPNAGLVTVTVQDVWFNTRMDGATKYVVSKVDTSAYEQRRKEAAERCKERERLQDTINELVDEVNARGDAVMQEAAQKLLKKDAEYVSLVNKLNARKRDLEDLDLF